MLFIDYDKCDRCGRCIEVCPFGGLEMAEGRVVVNEKCRLCRQCLKHCPQEALSIVRARRKRQDLSAWRGVLVYAEQSAGKIHPVTYELIGKGKELAQKLDQPLSCVLVGHGVREAAQDLLKYGLDKVYVYDYPELKYFSIEPYAAAVGDAIAKLRPSILLIGATSIGRSLAPVLAVRFRTGLTADCTVLDVKENGDLVQIALPLGAILWLRLSHPGIGPKWPQSV